MNEREDLETLASTATGSSVTVESLRESIGSGPLHQLLGESEQPQYLLRGTLLDIGDRTTSESESGQRRRKVASPGTDLLTLITDERVLIVIPREANSEQLNVPLTKVTEIEGESAPGASERLCVHTEETTYYVDTSDTESDETASAREFVTEEQSGTEPSDRGENDPLETIERLADLHERGVLSDDEFEQKKDELLDQI